MRKILVIHHKRPSSTYSLRHMDDWSFTFMVFKNNAFRVYKLPEGSPVSFYTSEEAVSFMHEKAIEQGYTIITLEKFNKLNILQ